MIESAVGKSVAWADTRVERRHGVPTLIRQDRPWFGWAAQRPYLGDETTVFERLSSSGLRHAPIDVTCAEDMYHPKFKHPTDK